jgi:CheY-like chemotaxis protein
MYRSVGIDSSNRDSVVNQRPSVLLVEDDPVVQLIHKNMLEELHCSVETAASAQEALEKAGRSYHLIILDVGLPDVKGTLLAEKLRLYHMYQETHIVFVTTVAAETLRELCAKLSIQQVINKPVKKESFERAIARCMRPSY